MQLGIWAWIPPLPPFFCNSMISEKNIWVRIYVQFHFLCICRTSWKNTQNYKSNHAYFTFSLLTSDVLGKSWTDIQKRPTQIFGLMIIWSKYLDFSNCVFTMNCSTEKKIFFWYFMGRDSSTCEKSFIFLSQAIQVFCKNILYFGQLLCKYYFSG